VGKNKGIARIGTLHSKVSTKRSFRKERLPQSPGKSNFHYYFKTMTLLQNSSFPVVRNYTQFNKEKIEETRKLILQFPKVADRMTRREC
jgi:hypothetical protein